MSARPRAAGSCPPPGPLASTRDSTATAWTRCWTSALERTLAKAADAHALVAARSQSWRMGEKSRWPEWPNSRRSQRS